jgi:hypothetical protein
VRLNSPRTFRRPVGLVYPPHPWGCHQVAGAVEGEFEAQRGHGHTQVAGSVDVTVARALAQWPVRVHIVSGDSARGILLV